VGRTTPTEKVVEGASVTAEAEVGAVVTCGAVVVVAVAQPDNIIAAMNKMESIAENELFLLTFSSPL
jgi:hypothetical protein